MKSAWLTVLSMAVCCAAVLAAFAPSPASADSGLPPKEWSELSASGEYRFTATPAPHDDYNPIDEDVRPTGRLERRIGQDVWQEVWRAPLLNAVLPTSALVGDEGGYVVTFDNWYSTGHGANVIVVYDAEGSLVRSMMLTDLIPAFYKDSLSHSVGSVDWLHKRSFAPDQRTAFLDVYAPGKSWRDKDIEPLRFHLALADGSVVFPADDKWQRALAKARALTLERVRDTLEYNRVMRLPLAAPQDCSPFRWDFYLREVYQRLGQIGSESRSIFTYVLRPEDDEDADRQFANFKGWATDRRFSDNQMAVAAPCASGQLITAIRDIAQLAAKTGDAAPLSMLTLRVAAGQSQFAEVDAILASTGAKVIWLDPERAVAQRADRMPDNDKEVAELESYRVELMEQVKEDQARGLSD